jgi:hypothetical protein
MKMSATLFVQACRKVTTLLQGIAISSPAALNPPRRTNFPDRNALQIVNCFTLEATKSFASFPKASSSLLIACSGLNIDSGLDITTAKHLGVWSTVPVILRGTRQSSAIRALAGAASETMADESLGINVGFIGAGQMAEAMARGFSKAGVVPASQQFATDPSEARLEVFKSFGVTAMESNAKVRSDLNPIR